MIQYKINIDINLNKIEMLNILLDIIDRVHGKCRDMTKRKTLETTRRKLSDKLFNIYLYDDEKYGNL
jgi:hypothetical protein